MLTSCSMLKLLPRCHVTETPPPLPRATLSVGIPIPDWHLLPAPPVGLADSHFWSQHHFPLSAADNIASASASTWIIIGAAIIFGLLLWRRDRKKQVVFIAAMAWWSVVRCGNEAEVILIGLMLPVLYVIWFNKKFPSGADPFGSYRELSDVPGVFPWTHQQRSVP